MIFISSHLLSSPLASLSPLTLVSSRLLSSSFISFCPPSLFLPSPSHSPLSHNITFHLLFILSTLPLLVSFLKPSFSSSHLIFLPFSFLFCHLSFPPSTFILYSYSLPLSLISISLPQSSHMPLSHLLPPLIIS